MNEYQARGETYPEHLTEDLWVGNQRAWSRFGGVWKGACGERRGMANVARILTWTTLPRLHLGFAGSTARGDQPKAAPQEQNNRGAPSSGTSSPPHLVTCRTEHKENE